MEIQIEIKEVYGNTSYYPICENAKLFAKIAKTKTLTKDTLMLIKTLGITIVSLYKGQRVIGLV